LAIEITEKMTVPSNIDDAWQFIIDPERVVTCMPGAELVERIDDRTYLGRVKVKLGAITTDYKGEVAFATVDESGRTLRLTGEGRETGGGTAKGTLDVSLTEIESGTELVFEIRVDLTGRVMQMGRGMIKGVSSQIFKQFANAARQQIQAASGAPGPDGATPAPVAQASLSVAPLVGRTIWQAIVDFLARIFGRSSR